MTYIPKKKRVKLVEWQEDFVSTEKKINEECKFIEEIGGNILSIKIFDESDPDRSPASAIVYET